MHPRLIPWCLAVTGFFVALVLFTWQARPDGTDLPLPPRPQTAHVPLPRIADAVAQAPSPDASAEPVATQSTQVLPLPPATRPDPNPAVQPVPDNEPVVDDLPVRPNPPPQE
ncbi:MAG TPA: hypothetical protein VMF03_20680 [Steroidobacteraceae bacterium]|nr:hypothetical protein [Steroidobacteraceae bacterium]